MLRLAWLDEEVEGVAAELGSVSGRRGEAGGGGYGERRRPTRSDTSERAREKGKSTGERGVRPGDRGGTEKKRRGVALAG